MRPRARLVRLARLVPLVVALAIVGSGPALAAGKPGYPDKVTWSGDTWSIKTSRSAVGPGPNVFAKENVSVVGGQLRLRIAKNASGTWTTAEIIGSKTYGYGTYTFTVSSNVATLDPNVVLGLFTWSDKAPYAHREIDIEFARWANAADPTNAQYVVQPYGTANHLARFTQPGLTTTTHTFRWQPGSITWTSRDAAGNVIASYAYTGSDVPLTGDEKVRLNLWLFNGAAPTDGQPVEVAIDGFSFAP